MARIAADMGAVPVADGFGCSDCGCRTHLFRASDAVIGDIVSEARMRPFQK